MWTCMCVERESVWVKERKKQFWKYVCAGRCTWVYVHVCKCIHTHTQRIHTCIHIYICFYIYKKKFCRDQNSLLTINSNGGGVRSVMVKAMNRLLQVSKCELIGKGMNFLILPTMGWIVPLLFFNKDRFCIN